MARKYFITSLLFIIAALLAVNLFVVHAEMILNRSYSFAWKFYFDRRLNFPFFFSLSLLIINIVLLVNIIKSKTHSPHQLIFWKTLLIAFVVFAIDEAFYLHQHFKMSTFGTIASYDRKSWTHYLWVLPYFVLFGFLIVRIFRHSSEITRHVRRQLVLAAILFLTGAVVMEFAGTFYGVIRPKADLNILLIKSVEGVLQMLGSVLFINVFVKCNWPDAKPRD